MDRELISAWPGKTIGKLVHPALWHMLDVGAVASVLMSHRSLTGSAIHDKAAVFFVTLHDLGKFSSSFRAMLLRKPYSGFRHWQHSYRLLRDHDEVIAALIGATIGVRRNLYAAVAGHHGGPPQHLDHRKHAAQARQIGRKATVAARDAIVAIAPLFPGASLNGLSEPDARRLSWALSGLTVLSDWIGSNPEWFGPQEAGIPVRTYWKQARERAAAAISAAGLHHARPVLDGAAKVLPSTVEHRPMQAAAARVPLPRGPLLAVLEDTTGSGKTEAALMLAARMMAAGKGDGFYFALPTMATSNAMLARLEPVAPSLFSGRPSLALTHGRARLNPLFREIVGRQTGDLGTRASCGRWMADDRRRVLLADVGVGTVDQALMAVLPTRFNTLRLKALSSRILIVDEAHEFDPYMEAQLQRLLQFHAMLGGSAIIMTATLPLRMRVGYTRAFQEGLGLPRPAPVRGDEYPLLTIIGRKISSSRPAPAPSTCRDVAIRRLDDEAAAIAVLMKGAKQGAACVWIRNTVDGAIAAVKALRAVGADPDLLHARFAMEDRLKHESALQARFGRQGAGREGRVLVATQVVEASLDLDFDVMVTDLAPVGPLIQRAGRLWRHMDLRPPEARPVPGPVMHIVSPDPDRVSDSKWLNRVLGIGALIYPHDQQWRTARAVFDRGRIRTPHDLRELIEAVHGSFPQELPDPLQEAELETAGRTLSEAQQALNQVLDAEDGYDQPQMQHVFEDDRFPTRLGIPQVTLRLAREETGALSPWAGKGPSGWQSSEVQVSAGRYKQLAGVDQDRPEIAALREKWPAWKLSSILVAPVRDDGVICEGLRYARSLGIVYT